MKCVSLLFYALSGVLSCSINMCFRCTVESNRLTFICKVDDLLWPVDIYDNHGNEIAHCALPNPASKCRHSNENANVKVNVEQFLHKNETVMVLTGTIDQRLNGNWSCHHGIKLYKANVVINILKATGSSIWIYIACGLIAICIVLIVILTYSCVKGFWTNKQGNSGGQSQPLMNISEGNSGGGQSQPFTTINEAIVFTATVKLSGPQYIKRNGNIHVMCSSDETPIFATANFLMNGKMIESLRKDNDGCYSARDQCQMKSLKCFCSKDGKKYGLLLPASIKTMMITISCTMKFERNGRLFSKRDSVQVQIHDPPLLNLENFVMCNISSSVQITCSSNGHIKSFGDWEHSYSGKLIRYVPGKVSNNTSTISIVNCSLEDLGEYTCIAWNRIQNETYWSNVTTRLLVYGPPTILWIKSTGKHDKPIIFSLSFYSPQTKTSVHWTKDFTPVDNVTSADIKVYQNNITIEMYGKPLVNIGYITSLTVNERSASVYSVILINEFGEYSHQFTIEAGEDFFSLRTVVWILICLAVFLLTVTIATISFSRRSRIYLKRFENAGNVSIYYAAPTSVYNISPYAATRLEYEEPLNIQQATLRRENEEIEEREEDNETNHYIEVL